MVLVNEGVAHITIALADDAIPAEKTAATELASYLEKISGARFEIKPEAEVPATAPQILVGAGKRVKSLLPNQNWKRLEHDGIVIKTQGNKLILAGGRPRGSLYAVFTFLEDTLGVRWWTNQDTTVPTSKTVSIGALNTVYVPPFQTREGHNTSLINDPYFATRLKINGHYQRQTAEWGGQNSILGMVHTFHNLLPIEKYFKEHPEWYSDPENGNKPCTAASAMPKADTWQLCLSSESARLELTQNALKLLRDNPNTAIISISQNDFPAPAADPIDMALADKEGSPAGPLVKFVNAVAEDIEKEFPDVLVETLAYQYSQKPPRTIKPRHNVVIRLCSIEADVAHPLNSEANATFRDDIAGWKKIASHMYFWNYVTNFDHMNVPFPNMRNLGKDIRFFSDSKGIGLFEQGDSESNGIGDFVALRVWLVAHLMWNPSLDQRKLEDEFLRGYYGAAAPHLRAYLDNVQSSFEARPKDEKLGVFQLDYSYLSLDVLNRATRSFRLAEAAVAGDEVLTWRVQRERIALDNAWLRRYNTLRHEATVRNAPFEGPSDPVALGTNIVSQAKKYDLKSVRFLNIPRPIDEYVAALLQRVQPPSALPAVALGKSPDDIIDAQESAFRLGFLGTYVEEIEDAKASNKRAARLIGTSYQWAIQFWPRNDFAKLEPGPWRCYVVAKVEPKAGVAAGHAMTFGIYDTTTKKEVFSEDRKLENLVADGEYHTLDFGVHNLTDSVYFFLAKSEGDSIQGVAIDRILLVREPKSTTQK